ncbi:MAG: hypothetical protein A3F84_19925 [Candidatus Handelsmanbacteria bacterium RIFCSPLOWO2_12_FULL_64_10]|uniref:Peptidase M48 domain-containing protein n=1 Tax=Handelsmanbacteria sp. (strain RIFCSPLOWO2_12_FULL_64_10) TaxID=1817868 RepID=A0A1F6D2K3_HANXR|nr:MAG: hypothetical protein A3F84_19925 [Candidatus Handelsmanbacteria bacterium RIFCSPLOWO2_12_FULL_64_10]
MRRALFALLAPAIAGCGMFGEAEELFGGSENYDLTESQEYYVGRTVAARTLKQHRLYGGPDHPLQAYVTRVGTAIAVESDRPLTFGGYHFIAIESDEVNAFAAPGGFIFVTTALLREARSEDELAGVLAHEIAHVNLNHPEDVAEAESDKATATSAAKLAASAAATAGADVDPAVVDAFGVAADAVGEMVVNGYSREKEEEADALAARILVRPDVRYDPRGLTSFLARTQHRGGWLGSTHPDPKARIAALERIFATLGPLPATDPARTQAFEDATRELR